MTRTAWLAVAAAAIATGCGGNGGGGDAAGNGDAGPGVSPDTLCFARSGYFTCNGTVCSRAIEACTAEGCYSYSDLAQCGSCPTCACLLSQESLDIDTCTDDGAGGITYTVLTDAPEGAACRFDGECASNICDGGTCKCLPVGTSLGDAGDVSNCCSGVTAQPQNVCGAAPSSPCKTSPDCFGGTCTMSACACVGTGGSCGVDSDCCAGAKRCNAQGACE